MKKSIRLLLVAPTVALLIVAVCYLSFRAIEQLIIEENETLVHNMAQSLLPALLAGDSQQVEQLLKALETHPGIQSADLISGAGVPLASYVRDGSMMDVNQGQFALASAGEASESQHLHVMAPLTFDTQILANLHIAVNVWPVYLRIIQWLGVLLIVPSVLYVFFKQLRLQFRIEKIVHANDSGSGDFDLGQALQTSLKDADISVEYQPIQRMSDKGIYGAEVVICWKHPSGQTLHIAPSDFIALAEASGLFLPFGTWVLENACQQMACWQHQYGPLVMALNIAPNQLMDAQFADEVRRICASTRYPHQLIEFEINEAMLLSRPDAKACTQAFTQQGMSLTLDGFGLSPKAQDLLAEVLVHKVKFAPQLIKNIAHDDEMFTFVQSLATYAQAFDLQVMADGLHSDAQAQKLHEMNCSLVQGRGFSPPLTALQFENLLSAHAGQFAMQTHSNASALQAALGS